LQAGTYEVNVHAPAFSAGIDPGFAAIFNLPGVWDEPREVRIWLEEFGGAEIIARALAQYNIHYVGYAVTHPEPFMSKKPLRTLDDFEGLKLRTTPGLTHNLFERLGAVPIAMSGPEIYQGLQTGLIDAAEFITITDNWGIGLHEVTDYILWPSIHSPTAQSDVSVNMDAWNKLPNDLKVSFRAAVRALDQFLDFDSAASDFTILEQMKAYGLEHTQLSKADFDEARQMGIEIAEEWKSQSALSNEVISSVFDYLKVTGKMQ
jgi:TRAP-type mannitol/chloroaromatic compound transport system substrate-binding protein